MIAQVPALNFRSRMKRCNAASTEESSGGQWPLIGNSVSAPWAGRIVSRTAARKPAARNEGFSPEINRGEAAAGGNFGKFKFLPGWTGFCSATPALLGHETGFDLSQHQAD